MFLVIGYPDSNRLRIIPKQPTYPPGFTIPKMTKRVRDVRGPELVHTKLIHEQYGIVALAGGHMTNGHFEMFRNTVNKQFDLKKAFAFWRVDPPWKPITRHGQGKKLGGGKGAIDHYVTPVKRGRIIFELGGELEDHRARRVLLDLAQKLPFAAQVVTKQELEQWEQEAAEIKANNTNKLRWEWCLKNNILNVVHYVGKYDLEYCHLGPNCR